MFGKQLKALIKKRGMTLKELAYMSGVSINTIYAITNGRNNPTEKTMELLMNALDYRVSPDASNMNHPLFLLSVQDLSILYFQAIEAVEIAEHLNTALLTEEVRTDIVAEAVKVAIEKSRTTLSHPVIDKNFVEFLVKFAQPERR